MTPVRILLVEDNPDHALLIRQALQADGRLAVTVAGDADRGLAQARDPAYDLVLLDYSLPRNDGLMLLKTLQAEGIPTPVIMLTGHGSETIAVAAMRAGAYDYIVKQAGLWDLPNTVERALESHRLRRRAEDLQRQVAASEERLRTLVSSAHDAIFEVEPETGDILDANPQFCRMTGVSPQAGPPNLFNLLTPPGVAEARQAVSLALQGEAVSREFQIQPAASADSPFVHCLVVHCSVSRVEYSGVRRVLFIARDVTEEVERRRALAKRERAARALYELGNRLNSLELEGISDLALSHLAPILDFDLAAVLYLAAARPLLSLHAARPVGRARLGELSAELTRELRLVSDVCFGAEDLTPYVVGQVIEDGGDDDAAASLYLSRIAAPLVVAGRAVGLLAAYHRRPAMFGSDDSQTLFTVAGQMAAAMENTQLYQALKERAEWLERAYAEVRQAARLKEELIQNVSHEVRTPLTFINGFGGLLLSGSLGELPTAQRESLEIVHRAAQRLSGILGNILSAHSLARSGPGPSPLDRAPVGLGDLVRAALDDHRQSASQGNLTLIDEVPEDLPPVDGDAAQLNDLFHHLLDNAIKFSSDGGRVWLRARALGPVIEVGVVDEGVGIPEASLPRIFDEFYQADGSTTRRFGGVGLGLSLARTIVEAHGGQIWAERRTLRGSAFHFTLPIAR
ncbi:MAG: response regulator [Chloroflexi bacterium]|nr:response regulator [Chloroflexota bacterium]